MAYSTKVLQVLIASPSDVEHHRSLIVEVINDWNNLNARDSGLMLQPVRWETNAAPDMRQSPQDVINAQIVDEADMVVGVFWTRLGTPTGEAQSGTAEEIERVGKAGKRVMIYFSDEPASLRSLDTMEFERLRAFRSNTFPRGFVESFDSPQELVDKFRRQLDMAVRQEAPSISAEVRTMEFDAGDVASVLDVVLKPYSQVGHEVIDTSYPFEVNRILVTDHEKIVDYGQRQEASVVLYSSLNLQNRQYWRELVDYYEEITRRVPLAFQMTNNGLNAIGNPHVELTITSENVTVSVDSELPRPSRSSGIMMPSLLKFAPPSIAAGSINLSANAQGTVYECDWTVLQGGRTVVTPNAVSLNCENSGTVTFLPRLFSSAGPPVSLEPITLAVKVEVIEMTWDEFYSRIFEEAEQDS